MQSSKPALQSLTIRGALIVVIAQVLSLLKYTVEPALLEAIADWIFSAVTLVGAAVALWGRVRATQRIGDDSVPRSNWSQLSLAGMLVPGAAVALLILLAGCAGCAVNATPEARWAQQREILNGANGVFIEAAENRVLDDSEIVLIGGSLQLASVYLDEARRQLPVGGDRFERLMRVVDGVLEQAQRGLREAGLGSRGAGENHGTGGIDHRWDTGGAGSDRQPPAERADRAGRGGDLAGGVRADREQGRDLRRAA